MIYQTLDYKLLTEPETVVPIPKRVMGMVYRFLSAAARDPHPTRSIEWMCSSGDVITLLADYGLGYREHDPVQDVVALITAEHVARRDGQNQMIEHIKPVLDRLKKTHFSDYHFSDSPPRFRQVRPSPPKVSY